jgi:tRNA pseudouridine13 synthase
MNPEQQARAFDLDTLAHAYGRPTATGMIRTLAEDFSVEESLPFELSGEGEHLYLYVEKQHLNSTDVARLLAEAAGIRRRMVSMAGMKDKHALTRQWFSLHLAGKPDADFSALPPTLRILEQRRHGRKLRRGAIRQNRFKLRVRRLQGDHGEVVERLALIIDQGFPNYFGEQRFGHGYANLVRAIPLLQSGRSRSPAEGIYLSAARAMLFNRVLAMRVADGSWSSAMPGDVMQLSHSSGLFRVDEESEEISRRLAKQQIHVTGPLAGLPARIMPQGAAQRYEQHICQEYQFWSEGLERCGLRADRRALRAGAAEVEHAFEGEQLLLEFTLQRGCFATALLRELLVAAAPHGSDDRMSHQSRWRAPHFPFSG